jgi:hypothetical protein
MKNISESYKVIQVMPIAERTTTMGWEYGDPIDVSEYLDDALGILQIGVAEDTGANLDVSIEGSVDGGNTYPELVEGQGFAQVLDTDDDKIAPMGFNIGKYDHIRARWGITGGITPAFTFGVTIIVNTPVDVGGTNIGELE